jgi:uncharacterized protein YfdQ (DUF2303 family)
MELTRETIQEITRLSLAGQEIKAITIPDGTNGLVAVIGGQTVDLTPFRPLRPDRKRVLVNLYSVESFIEYVNEHKGENTRIFASLSKAPYTMTAAIDYHAMTPAGLPEFITHLAVLTLRTTDEWDRWSAKDKVAVNQIEFAEFVEENSLDIIDPNSATMMEIALSLQSNNEVRWKSAVRLNSGAVHLEFQDDAKAMAGKDGALNIPELFKINLAVFRGLEERTIEARFRYRLRSGSIALFYQLVRPQKLIDAMVLDAMLKVKSETNLPVFDGVFEKK